MTKLEQVARALHARLYNTWPEPECTQCMDDARMVVSVLREPTAMILAAGVAAETKPENGLLAAWQAMIDAILNEKSAISPGLDAAITDEMDHPPADIMKDKA
jgi:hypothetical protein